MILRSRLIRAAVACAIMAASTSAQTQNIAQLRHKAEAGDAEAQFELAKAYIYGTGVAMDVKQGLEWLRKSGLHGYSGAEVVLGVMYQKGSREVEKNPHEAANWFRKAARQGNKSAKDAKNAYNARTDLADMFTQGLISKQEANWAVPEPTQEEKKAKAPPFSLSEVETGLSGGITSKRMETLVNTFGVDFRLSTASRKRLGADGADEDLLNTISSSNRSF